MKWVEIGFKFAPLIISAVEAVERLVTSAKGKAKEDAAVDLAGTMLQVVEKSVGRDLLNDPAVQDATRKVIVASVALQNVIATRAKALSDADVA